MSADAAADALTRAQRRAEDSLALAIRAASPTGFRWVPGMREVESGALCVTVLEGRPLRWYIDGYLSRVEDEEYFPYMGDAGTRGHYLDLVREAWGDPGIHFANDGITWCMVNSNLDIVDTGYYETEGDALVCALKAAPR